VSRQLLFYEKVVPVSKQRHTGWSVKTGTDYAFAKYVNSVPVVAVEFPHVAVEHPIVFAGEGEGMMPAVLLGVRDNENLYVNDSNGWDAKYIPAFIRRYPFVFSRSNDGATFTLCIDEDFSGCNQDNRGERLFDAEGARSQYLENMLRFVNEYQGQYMRTQLFCKKLQELDLLEPMQAQFTLNSGQRLRLAGFSAVNRERLKRLTDEQVSGLFKTDELELVYLHLQSMRNFNSMLERTANQSSEQKLKHNDSEEAASLEEAHPPKEGLH
jgi:hypothetical protein